MPGSLVRLASGLWLPVGLAIWWWIGSEGSTSVYFPPLREILRTLWADLTAGPLAGDVGISLWNLFLGLAIAVIAGIGLGLLIGMNDRLRVASGPALSFLRAVPPAAIVPIVIAAMGVGAMPKIVIIAFGCIWPVLLNTIDGVRGLRPAIRDTVRAFRIPRRLVLLRVALPAALPQIMAGCRIALSVALALMVLSEFFAADSGLGFYVANSSQSFAIKQAWAGTLLIGILGYLFSAAFSLLERHLLGWYFQTSLKETAGPGRVRFPRLAGLARKAPRI